MSLEISVISGVHADVDGQPVRLRRQVQRLVAILVAAGPEGVEGSALAEELWVGDPPARWNSAIRNALTALRAEAGSDVVQTSSGRYSLQCDVENVDAWRVLHAAASPKTNGQIVGNVGQIGRFQPFNGLELTPLLQEMSEALHGARLQLIERVTSVEDLDPTLIAGLIASVRADPFAESTSTAVIRLLIRCGRESDALHLLDDIEKAYLTDLDAEPTPALVRVRRLAEGSADNDAVAPAYVLARSLPSVIGDLIQRPMTQHHVDVAQEVALQMAESGQPKRWSMLGLAGCGKSRFVAEVGQCLHTAGTDVIFATAVGDEATAYSPFLTASPAFRRSYHELATPAESAVWALWASIVEDWAAQGRPLTLIVDDAQHLDRPSIRLLQFTHRMQPRVPITTVIVGRNSTDEHDWQSFERELLDDDRTAHIDVPPLDSDDINELIRRRWPHVSELISQDAAIDVLTASAGLPMVAHLLIESLTGPTLRLPRRRRSHHVDMAVDQLQAFDADAQAVIAAATLLSSPFAADDLASLLDRDPDDIEATLELAARAAVLSNMEVPGTYRFVHELLREGAVGLVTKTVRAEWSHRLMAATEDPLRLAHLAVVARALITPETFARYLATGARAALDRNLCRRCVGLAQAALDIGSEADHEALACLALSQAKLGALDEAAASRARLLERTHSPTEHLRATRTLIDSITLADTDSRAAIRVEDFDRLEVAGLSHELQLERALRLARLAANVGAHHRRDDELALARSLQRSDNEAGQLFHAEWACEHQHVDDAWFARLADLRERVDRTEVAAVLTQVEVFELASFGRWHEAEQSNDALRRVAAKISPELQWQSTLAASGLEFAQGHLAASEQLADEAFEYGMLFALPLAPAARAAQAFGAALYTGDVDNWLEMIETVSPDFLRNTLAMTAASRARFEVGRVDEAWRNAEPILIEVLDGERRHAVSVVSVLAPLIRKRASPLLQRRCSDLLSNSGDRWVVTRAGFGVHGPVVRSLAILEGDRRALQRLRHRLADQPLWAAVVDSDIARIEREV